MVNVPLCFDVDGPLNQVLQSYGIEDTFYGISNFLPNMLGFAIIRAVAAGKILVDALYRRHGTFRHLDDFTHGNLSRRPGKPVAAAKSPLTLNQPMLSQGNHDLFKIALRYSLGSGDVGK